MGIEPTTLGFTNRCSNQLSYAHRRACLDCGPRFYHPPAPNVTVVRQHRTYSFAQRTKSPCRRKETAIRRAYLLARPCAQCACQTPNGTHSTGEAPKHMNPNDLSPRRRSFLKGALATPVLIAGSAAMAPAKAHDRDHSTATGPSTSTEPYLLPSIRGAKTVSILTVGDSIGGYRMVGIPDGLGAFESGHGDFTLLMNHELGGTAGAVRAHGSKGAFVSRWVIDADTLRVKKGQDLTDSPNKLFTWNSATRTYAAGTTIWQRFCSADLPKPGAFRARGIGTSERIYMGGEEVTDGR